MDQTTRDPPVLQITQLDLGRGDSALLHGVDLQLAAGEILALIGANGAGKSTLLKTIAGDLSATAGSIHLNGRAIASWPAPLRARQLAYLPQTSQLNFPFSVAEVVALGRIPHLSGSRADWAVVEQVLDALDLNHLRQRAYTQLSGGEKQRVQLARVLAQVWRAEDSERRLLLLDEPTNAIDIAHKMQLVALLKTMAADGCAVVMVLHDFSFAAQHVDRMLALCGGRVCAQGTPVEVITPARLQQIFSVSLEVIPHPQSGAPLVVSAL